MMCTESSSGQSFQQLAEEIREFLIESVSKTGGHLASNLGAVELTMALTQCVGISGG